MHFNLDEDQQMVADAARQYLGRLPGIRALLEGHAPTPDGWEGMVDEQSWQALMIPLDHGGFGFNQVSAAVVLEELGRALVPSPFLGTAWATAALLECPASDARDSALASIAEGAPGAAHFGGAVTVDGAHAKHVVLVRSDGVFLADVEREETASCLDPTRTLSTVQLGKRTRLGDASAVPFVRARAMALLACESVGVAEATMDLAVDYAKMREQFGGPIGRFQAVQHMCADMLVDVESARSAAWFAAWATCPHANPARTAEAAESAGRTALCTATEAAMRCAGISIQVHGGIGFTWEHACHLYFKRARVNQTLLGEPRRHRHALAERLLGPIAATETAWT